MSNDLVALLREARKGLSFMRGSQLLMAGVDENIIARIDAALTAAQPEAEHVRVPVDCEWKQDEAEDMADTWAGKCGAMWTFTEGGPIENDMHFCPQCGGKLLTAAKEPK